MTLHVNDLNTSLKYRNGRSDKSKILHIERIILWITLCLWIWQLNEADKFLERHKLPKLAPKEKRKPKEPYIHPPKNPVSIFKNGISLVVWKKTSC